MDRPLSFSGYKKYHDCPQYYKYHYIDNDRPGKNSSALAVGTAVDEIVEAILLKKDYDQNAIINAAKAENVVFYDDDFDADLVDLQKIETFAKSLGWAGDDIVTAIKDMLKDQETLSDNQQTFLNFAVWESLTVKINAMVESFNTWILPQIAEVHEVQTKLDNELLTGKLDFTATLKDGRKVLFDLKTSKRGYEKDAVLFSPQLSLYAAMHDYEYAGFVVLSKSLNKNKVKTCPACKYSEDGGRRKNCPKCKTVMDFTVQPTSYSQIIVDKIPESSKELTLNALKDTIKSIDGGHFPRNLSACSFMYGKPCIYKNKCWNINQEDK